MTFENFKKKYANRKMYEHGGRIDHHFERNIFCEDYRENIMAELFFTPSWHGWKDENQRRKFYSDAKKAGVRRLPGKKNVWYKRIWNCNQTT